MLKSDGKFEDAKVPARVRLMGLWAAVTFCYVYGDFVGLFIKGRLSQMNAGIMGPLGDATPNVLLGVAILMSIPALMVFLTLVLAAPISRWLNIIFGLVFTAVMIATMIGAPPFYLYFGVIEVALTILIVWTAWTWPRTAQP